MFVYLDTLDRHDGRTDGEKTVNQYRAMHAMHADARYKHRSYSVKSTQV